MKEDIQHLPDIEIPDIEIDKGWPVSDVQTINDCDDAFALLMSAVAKIEFDIEVETLKPKNQQDGLWLAKARCALKYKKAALQIVNFARGRIADEEKRKKQNTRDRILLEYIRKVTPNEMFMQWVRESDCASGDTM